MKKKILSVLLSVLLVGTLTGCGTDTSNSGKGTNPEKEPNPAKESSKSKGNCTAVECIKKIEITNTVEEINNIIGFEGKLIDEKNNKWEWELSEKDSIEATFYTSGRGNIKAKIDRDSIANKKVDFSKYDQLKTKINDGITYDEFIKYIGNVEGIIIEKNSSSTKYDWVDTDGSYLSGSFSTSSNKCTFVSGMIK